MQFDFNGYKLKVETKSENRFGHQEIVGSINDDEAISLSDGALGPDQKWMWRVTSSRTVPTTLEEAEAYQVLQQACIKKAKTLDLYYRCRWDLFGKLFYHLDTELIYKLDKITPNDVFVTYHFEVRNLRNNRKSKAMFNSQNIVKLLTNSMEIEEDEYNELLREKIQEKIKDLQNKLLTL